MRPLSPASAIIANDLIDNGLADPHSPDQEIADTVNWRRTQHGQDALTQLGEMAPPWRRRVLPADPPRIGSRRYGNTPLHRASTSMQSAPPAPPPAVALSGELAFDPMDFLDIPDTPISASSAPAFQEVANQSELSVPAGEPAPPAPPPAVALSGELAFDPMDFLDIPDTPISASSALHSRRLPTSRSCRCLRESLLIALQSRPPSIELFPWRWTLSRPFTFSFIDSQFVHACDGHAGYRQHGKGRLPPAFPHRLPARARPANSRSTLAGRKKVIDPETGETVSKAALAGRKKVIDPETGETVSRNALAKRKKVIDPETGKPCQKPRWPGARR